MLYCITCAFCQINGLRLPNLRFSSGFHFQHFLRNQAERKAKNSSLLNEFKVITNKTTNYTQISLKNVRKL